VGVGEHVWPLWLIGDFHGEGPFHTEKSGEPYKKRDGVTVAEFGSVQGVHVPMCTRCNGVLDRFIEAPAKPVVRRVMSTSATAAVTGLTADEAASLSRWFLKVALLLAHPDAENDNPHVARDAASRPLTDFRHEWVAWLGAEVDPPDDFSVYVTRRSAGNGPPFAGDREHVTLPGRVVVDGDEQRFMARSVGIRGLEATIVWHPGWPIRHPLVEEGRAAVLWPNPAAVDLAPLPEVHPGEFAFAVDPTTVRLTEAQHSRVTRIPLQVGLLPAMALLGDAALPLAGGVDALTGCSNPGIRPEVGGHSGLLARVRGLIARLLSRP
jgi:hypothetical protein